MDNVLPLRKKDFSFEDEIRELEKKNQGSEDANV